MDIFLPSALTVLVDEDWAGVLEPNRAGTGVAGKRIDLFHSTTYQKVDHLKPKGQHLAQQVHIDYENVHHLDLCLCAQIASWNHT